MMTVIWRILNLPSANFLLDNPQHEQQNKNHKQKKNRIQPLLLPLLLPLNLLKLFPLLINLFLKKQKQITTTKILKQLTSIWNKQEKRLYKLVLGKCYCSTFYYTVNLRTCRNEQQEQITTPPNEVNVSTGI